MNLNEQAMLAHVTVRMITFSKRRKDVAQEVADANAADNEWLNLRTRLISREVTDKLNAFAVKVRSTVYKYTLPWITDGPRILHMDLYHKFTEEVRALEDEMERMREDIIGDLPERIEEAKGRLGELFDPALYPTPDAIRERIRLDVYMMPLPAQDDFRLTLRDGEEERIKAEIETRLSGVMQQGVREVYARIINIVSRIASYTEKSRVYESTWNGLRELVEIMPALNIAKDPDLDRLRRDVERELLAHDFVKLKDNPAAKVEMATRAKRVMGIVEEDTKAKGMNVNPIDPDVVSAQAAAIFDRMAGIF